MQELSNPKYSNALLNGIKDSLNPSQSDANAIQDLLRAASLLGTFGLPAGALSGLAGLPNQSSKSSKNSETKSLAGDSSATSTPSKTNDREKDDKTPSKTENGRNKEAGNGKNNHEHDTPVSDDSGKMISW